MHWETIQNVWSAALGDLPPLPALNLPGAWLALLSELVRRGLLRSFFPRGLSRPDSVHQSGYSSANHPESLAFRDLQSACPP